MAQENQFRCTGDCFKCQPLQRQYCAAQFTYKNMRMLERMQESLASMQGTVDELREKIEAIQGNEAAIFDPTVRETVTNCDSFEDTAHDGSGAAE